MIYWFNVIPIIAFNSMFLKTYVKDNDPLWAAAMSIATANKCNKKTGVNKININRNKLRFHFHLLTDLIYKYLF